MRQTKHKFTKLSGVILMSLVFTLAIALLGNAEVGGGDFDCNLTITNNFLTDGGIINVSFNNSDDTLGNMTVAIFAKSASTANSSFGLIGNATNSTGLFVNISINRTTQLQDSNDYIMFPRCYANISINTVGGGEGNILAEIDGANVTGITVDFAVPQAANTLVPSGRNVTTKDHTFRATVNGANTTQGSLNFVGNNPGQANYAMTHSGNTLSLSINDIAEGIYEYTITASDGTNSTISAKQTFTVDLPSSASRKAKLFGTLGGAATEEGIARGLAIAEATKAGTTSIGLAKAQAQVSQFVKKETTRPELTKTGISAAVGLGIGILVPLTFIPGVGIITAPILGILIGTGVGIAI